MDEMLDGKTETITTITLNGAGTARPVRVLTYNILAGGGSRMDAIEQVIRASAADVVGVVEVLQPEPLHALAERLGMYVAIGRSRSVGHVGALSRWPILAAESDDGGVLNNALLDTLIEVPGGARLRLFVVHLNAQYYTAFAGEGQRLREIRHVLDRMARTARPDEARVLVGDFNSLPPEEPLRASHVLRQALATDAARANGALLVGMPGFDHIVPPPLRPLRPAIAALAGSALVGKICDVMVSAAVPRAVIRRVLRTGYVDCYAAAHPDPRRRGFTCPSTAPAGRIDYIFADPETAVHLRECEILSDAPGLPIQQASDHRPVLATFALARRRTVCAQLEPAAKRMSAEVAASAEGEMAPASD